MNKSRMQHSVALKFDMSKVYDGVEWGYPRAVMLRMGFRVNFGSLVMSCVSFVSLSLLVRGQQTERFYPQWCVRKGDPLSPHLFLICTEGFLALLQRAQQEGDIVGIKVPRSGLTISHLLFLDDSIFFTTTSVEEGVMLKYLLEKYAIASR